jgi:hypothetical protein
MSCLPREAANTAQSSPMPNGARGDAAPSHSRMARISFSSPHAETDSCGRFREWMHGVRFPLRKKSARSC